MSKPVPNGCGQGRWPERSNSAVNDDDDDGSTIKPMDRRTGALIGALLILAGWPAAIVLVAACYGIAQYLPVFLR